MPEQDELPPRLTHSPYAAATRLHYAALGVGRWTADRFLRLCATWGETPEEMGARIGLDRASLERRLQRGRFNDTEGILLTLHERYARELRGYRHTDELFPPPR